MLPSQRALFEMPRDICYLNALPTARYRSAHRMPAAPRLDVKARRGRSPPPSQPSSTSERGLPPPA